MTELRTVPGLWLAGKTALVTGGSRGIGLGIVEAFVESGATVIVNALDPVRLEALRERLESRYPRQVYVLPQDVTTKEGAQRAIARALEISPEIDILVNTVGDAIQRPLNSQEEIDAGRPDEAFATDEILDLNLMSAIYCTQAIGPHMLKRESGRVISLAAVYGLLRSRGGMSLYSAGKSGLVGFMKSVAAEWARKGITVNVIAPGILPDPANFSEEFLAELSARYQDTIPMGRFGGIHEIGPLAVFLASDFAAYMTGQAIAFDGGLSL